MKRVAVTCVFELTYNDLAEDDDVLKDVTEFYVNQKYLVKKYNEQFNVVQIEEINA
jgi:hypothetical protein